MPSAEAVLRLVRWPNALLSAAGVLLGAWWAGGPPFGRPALLAAGAAVGLAALANAYNDAGDAAIDLIAHPERPIPRGTIGVHGALAVAAVGGVLGITLAALARPELGALSLAVAAAMIAYTRWLKRGGLAGNLAVALIASLPFLYGAWSVGRPASAAPLVALAVPLHLAREIAKDLDDAAGDRGVRRTVPVRSGAPAARALVVAAVLAFAAVVGMMPVWSPPLAVPGVIALVPVYLATQRALAGQRGSPGLFKMGMVAALAALTLTMVIR